MPARSPLSSSFLFVILLSMLLSAQFNPAPLLNLLRRLLCAAIVFFGITRKGIEMCRLWNNLLWCAVLAIVLTFAALAQTQTAKPNIVFILVDNVGWGDFGAYGGTTPTPRIDKLANEGIRFLNYNVEAPRLRKQM